MNGAEIVEVVILIVAFGCVTEMVIALLGRADEKLGRILAEEKSITYLRRALDAEAQVEDLKDAAVVAQLDLKEIRIKLRQAHEDFDRHTDQALEVAEPSPDLRRVR